MPTTGELDTQWMQANWRFMGTTMTVYPGGNVEVRDQAGALVAANVGLQRTGRWVAGTVATEAQG